MFHLILKLKILCLVILALSATSKPSDETIEATFDDWLKVCTKSAQNCVGVTFAENESGKRVARFVLDLTPEGRTAIKAFGTLLIPYETAIPHLVSGI